MTTTTTTSRDEKLDAAIARHSKEQARYTEDFRRYDDRIEEEYQSAKAANRANFDAAMERANAKLVGVMTAADAQV